MTYPQYTIKIIKGRSALGIDTYGISRSKPALILFRGTVHTYPVGHNHPLEAPFLHRKCTVRDVVSQQDSRDEASSCKMRTFRRMSSINQEFSETCKPFTRLYLTRYFSMSSIYLKEYGGTGGDTKRDARSHQSPRVSVLDGDLEGLEVYLPEGTFAHVAYDQENQRKGG